MTSRKATATDDQIREALAQGLPFKAIKQTLHVGQRRIDAIRKEQGYPRYRHLPGALVSPPVEAGDEAEPEAADDGDEDTVSVPADYLHALEAVVILTHMLAAAREA